MTLNVLLDDDDDDYYHNHDQSRNMYEKIVKVQK